MAEDRPRLPRLGHLLLLAAGLLILATLLFEHVSYPLLWHDESETAMFARRVVEYGYPKVRDDKNAVYSLWHRGGVGVDEASDAWTGTPWVQYYFGAIGVVLADRVDDLYAKTARVRLPFAVAGFVGLLVWAGAVLPAVRGRRVLFCALLMLLFAYSVSLQLHLREARYYALVVLLVGGALAVFLRRQVFGTLRPVPYAALLALLLVLLFNTFYPAFTALGVACGLFLAARALRRPGPERLGWLAREALPLVVALAAVLPLLVFFDFLEQARGWLARFGTPGLYLDNLRALGWHLLRFEFLAPMLALRAAVVLLAAPRARLEPELRWRLEIADFLLLLLVVYALLVAQTPFLFERYFVVLSPLVTTLVVLDAFSAWDLLRAAPGSARARPVALAGVALAAVCALGSVAARVPEFRGRLHEVREPYRGPLDFVIPYLKEHHAHPEELVIATNYEGPAYMFYLGSRVTVGFYGADLERDVRIVPDVIVPRPWPDHLEVLKALSERAPYDVRTFPVANLPWNNNPALRRHAHGRFTHRFATPTPDGDAIPLQILELRPEPSRSGGPPQGSPEGRG